MAKDPVCGMEGKPSISAAKKSKKYFFCSEHCKETFLGKKKTEPRKKKTKGKGLQNTELAIKGMHCASCVAKIESALRKVPGVRNATVNYGTEKAYIEYDPKKVSEKRFEKAN